jgi:hypothetical protein
MVKSAEKLEKLAAAGWCRPGEHMLWRVGPRAGHVGFDVAGRRGAPHDPAGRRALVSATPDWPLPTPVVAQGAFHGEEWVHDPSIWAHASARDVNALAIGCADGLVAGCDGSWLVQTTHRLAVLVGTSTIQSQSTVDDNRTGSGDWLTKAKSVAKAAQGRIEQARADEALTTLWETPSNTIHHFASWGLGRMHEIVPFGEVAFTDGSSLLVRVVNKAAADSIVETGNTIFAGR